MQGVQEEELERYTNQAEIEQLVANQQLPVRQALFAD